MAVVIGKLSLIGDLNSAKTKIKNRLQAADAVLNIPKRDLNRILSGGYAARSLESEWEGRSGRFCVRGKAGEGGDFGGEEWWNESGDEEVLNWEKGMRMRMKEMEEMRELERKAEELQSRTADEGGDAAEETEEERKLRVRKELEKAAKEQAELRDSAKLMFEVGQKAYGKGSYGRAIEFFEGALTIIPRPTLFGGEIQIWLAMAYEANNRHADCITLYRQLEKKHPSFSIRRQASELRYILQAPKLKISQEEMVTIPLIGSSYDSYAATWTEKEKDKRSGPITNQLPSPKDYLADFLVWRPPVGLEKSGAFWATATLLLCLVGAAFIIQ
ncbi:unnamed protein product [Rhodiola kirilowii]